MTKLLLAKKKRSSKASELIKARARRKSLRAEEDDLKQQVEELEEITPEIESKVDENADALAAVEGTIADLEDEIAALDEQISELEGSDPAADEEDPAAAVGARSAGMPAATRAAAPAGRFNCRSRCFTSRNDRDAFYARSEIKTFLQNVRALAGSGRRSVTGAELNIPTVMLDLMRDNIGEYSKLISHVRLVPVAGKARQNVLGKIPEGVWTEMCASLNELDFAFTQVEMDGFKVGGYLPICNAVLKDSDINLGEEIMSMLLYAIGYALDKAIVYGNGNKMPVGIVSRLAETSQPSYWGVNQGAWTDLHSSHIVKINLVGDSGPAFYQPLLAAMAKAEPNYTDGKSWYAMNRRTHMDLIGRGLTFDAAGTLVAGISNKVPVEGGDIIELDFIPDYEIIGGYGSAYLLVEREGGEVAQSEHVRFIEDQTVFKATARYDGKPVIGEAFVAINYNNTDITTAMTFAPDYANTPMNALICTAAAGTAAGDTVVTVSGTISDAPTLRYAVGYTGEIAVGGKVNSKFATLTSGTTQITASAGAVITVVELDAAGKIVSSGSVVSVPKT